MMKNKIIYLAFLLAIALNMSFVFAADAIFQVEAFSCSPSEVVINSIFSCTATVYNRGTGLGNLGTSTLYASGNWLESPTYAQVYGSSVDPGNSVSVTFTGLKAVQSGSNGFSKIMLDNSEDKFANVPGGAPEVNIINVLVTVSDSASSAAMNADVTSTADVTAGGNIDVSLSFTRNSGTCTIGSQTNPKTISGMTDGSKQSRTWTITQGTSGDCTYTISASATGAGTVATKTDSSSSTITCSNCPTSTTTSSSGGGGSGTGGGGAKIYIIGEITSAQEVELSDGEKVKFNISNQEHTLTLKNHTETTAKITIQTDEQEFILSVGQEIEVDLNNDGVADISVKLKSINTISGKVKFILSPIAKKIEEEEKKKGLGEAIKKIEEFFASPTASKIWYGLIVFFAVLAIASVCYYIIKRRKKKRLGYGRD